jgi:NADPH:quinone reductase-like Zn-dependent oxidoreductase
VQSGSYKQYIVSPERYTSLIPDGVPDEIAGPIMCSGSTAYTSIKESGLRPGQWAVFPGGGGGVGMQAVQLAIAMGLRAIVIDTGAERKEACLKFGADEFIDFKEVENPVERVLEITGGGAHAVFVTGEYSGWDEETYADCVLQPFSHTQLHKASLATALEHKSCVLVCHPLGNTTWRSTHQHSPSAISPSRARSSPVWLM